MSASRVIVARRIETTAQMPRTRMSRRRRRANASILPWVRGSRVPLIDLLLSCLGGGARNSFRDNPAAPGCYGDSLSAPALEHAGPLAKDPLEGQEGHQGGEPPPALPKRGVAFEHPLAAEGLQSADQLPGLLLAEELAAGLGGHLLEEVLVRVQDREFAGLAGL